ncbi:nuclear transport factor 2 family protein [Thalassotalea marina]|uniref:Nuclear transport factor 2 family protein n=1 Tax=Thalassotalea marina TaxID=1673741 RepID=A0A919BFQ4_9GAMM|nr:nuclear transport factor 2 family protein [Thalassotalea marina]GHF87946.1 hypothetical protein GCM10017161_14510 [Thalassotalea marina]
MKRLTLLITLLLCQFSVIASDGKNDDVAQIKQVIQWYFDGTSQGQPELIKKAFIPTLELQFVNDQGEFKRWLGVNYISGFEPGKTNDRVGKILSIDITGDAAIAKATITTKNRVFTDYFLLLKLNSGWKITNKIFTKKQSPQQSFSQ